MIISRYLLKEVFTTLIGVVLVLLLIFLSQQFVRYLNSVAAGKVAASMLLNLLGFEIPYLLALLLPLSVYLGILLAYSRLYANQEMSVLHACGFSTRRLVYLTSCLAAVTASIVLVLMLWVNPWIASHREQMLTQDLAYEHLIQTLLPGRFQASPDGRRVVYVGELSNDRKQAENVFIAEEKREASSASKNPWVVISATKGYAAKQKDTEDHFFVAANGYRYEGQPGKNDYKIIQFEKYAVRLPDEARVTHQKQEAIPSKVLWEDYTNPENAAELQWRLSLPISTFLLAWLAIPLSRVKPRQGKYLFLIPAILVYVVYANLLFVARHWVEQKALPISVGIWSIHGLLLVGMAIFMLFLAKTAFRPGKIKS